MSIKKTVRTSFSSLFIFGSIAMAATPPAAFVVEVDPPTFAANQSVDVTIKAVDKNGNVVKDYTNMVMIEFDETLEEGMYELPADGLYTFTKENQGVKKFSQGMKIREEGKYNLKVWDLQDENILGKQSIIVGNGGNLSESTKKGIAEIISPMSGEIITTQTINLMGKSDMTNATIQIYINAQQIEQEAETDTNGNFNVYIKDGIISGTNSMFIRVIKVDGNILAESSGMTFIYNPTTYDGIFSGLTITPKNTINAGEEVTFTVLASSQVRNVELKVGNTNVYVLDKKQGTNNFSKSAIITNVGTQPISATLILQGGDRKTYQNIDILNVQGGTTPTTTGTAIALSNIKVTRDGLTASQATLSRDAAETTSQYEVRYGTTPDNLSQSQITPTPLVTITGLEPTADYYFQVIPIDATGAPTGEPSSVIDAKLHGSADNTCAVGNISFTTTRVGNQYYLTWSSIAGATSYTIYRSDSATASVTTMQTVGTTSDTKYPYPFDPTSPADKYAWYAVQADCVHGAASTIDNVKRVKVGPTENMIALIIISLVMYGGYRVFLTIKS